MRDEAKSKTQLINELKAMRQRVAELGQMSSLSMPIEERDLQQSTGDAGRVYHDPLEALAAERATKLMKANEQLLKHIVEREWAEEALKKITSRYELAVKAGKVVVWDWDFWSHEIYIDPMLDTLLGFEQQPRQNSLDEWFSKVHPDDVEQVKDAVFKAQRVEGDSSFELEHRMLGQDGSVRWFLIRGTTLRDEQNHPYRLIGTNTDITEYKQAEAAIRQAHQELSKKAVDLETANTELAQYAYVVSHDLKTPLRAIHNYADFLVEDLQATLSGDQEEYLAGLLEAVQEAERLVNDLLELSRIGRKDAPLELVDLKIFLEDLLAALDLPADAEIRLADRWPKIEAQPPLLRQIFQNLIQNGLTFNRSSPKILDIGWQSVGQHHYQFFVRDNGIGIKPEYQQQIFNVFQRLHTNEEYPGTGIGLAIVKKAAEKLQGAVHLESLKDQGSTFFITLPKNKMEKIKWGKNIVSSS